MAKKIFMAFGAGTDNSTPSSNSRYIGVAPVKVLAVNPSKEKLMELYGNTNLTKDPEYTTVIKMQTPEGEKEAKQVRIDFIVKTVQNDVSCPHDVVSKITFFLRNAYRFNKDNSKVQIIDKYGRTAWVTQAELQAKAIPMYSSGPANIDPDYRPTFNGEEELTVFLKTYLGIPAPQNYVNGTWVDKTPEEKTNAESRLDKIADYFSGNITELSNCLKLRPDNIVKVAFGVKTSEDNKIYQTIYTGKVLRGSVSDYSKLDAHIQEKKNNGMFQDTEFSMGNLREYSVTPTQLSGTAPASNPFAGTIASGTATNPFAPAEPF